VTNSPNKSRSTMKPPLYRRWWTWWLVGMAVLIGVGSLSFAGGLSISNDPAAVSGMVLAASTSRPPAEVLGETATVPAPCVPASAVALAAIAHGAIDPAVSLARGFVVPVQGASVSGTPPLVIAARVIRPGVPDQVGTWGVGSVEGAGPIWSLNPAARAHTTWLEQASAGSMDDQLRNLLAATPAAAAALACASR
jgi:hypothetical protein